MGEYFLPNSVASAAAFDQISISTPNRVVFAVPTRDLVTVSEVNFALKGLIAHMGPKGSKTSTKKSKETADGDLSGLFS